MPQGRNTRLGRLAAGRAQARSAEAAHRCALRARVAVCTMLREALSGAGIDPAGVPALHLGDAAMAELAGLGDTPELRRADAAGDGAAPADACAARGLALARLCRERGRPDFTPDATAEFAPGFANASLAELLAWCGAGAGLRPGMPRESPT